MGKDHCLCSLLEENDMTGSLRIKTLPSGKSYYYVKLNYKDSKSGLWKSKTLATKLEVKNNKRKACVT